MNPRHAYAIFYRYILLLKGNFTRLFQIFVWGALDIVLWGFLTKYLVQAGAAGFTFGSALLGAVVLWQLVTRAQQGVSTPFLEDVWARNLLNFFGSPLRVQEYLGGLVFTSLVMTIIELAFVVVFAAAFFGFSLLVVGAPLFAFLLILFVFGIVLGLVAISILLRFGPSAEWFVWPIPTVISPFVGVFYPTTILPLWMQGVARVLPPSYVFNNMRTLLINGTFSGSDMLIALGLDLVLLILACLLFVRVYRLALKTGAIARYSAESFQ